LKKQKNLPIFALNKHSINNNMPRSKEANQKVKDERREQILAAALELFATKGLAATKISDISTKTGMSQGLIYHYYKSKEEVFVWLIGDAMEKMNSAALELEKMPVSAKEKIVIATEALLKGFDQKDYTAHYYFLITQTALSESFPQEAKEIVKTQNNVKYDVITRIFEEGQKDGTIKDFYPKEMAILFFSSINGLALNKAIYGSSFKMPDKNIFLSMFLKEL
jgi:AcrR family transcriptional regulator